MEKDKTQWKIHMQNYKKTIFEKKSNQSRDIFQIVKHRVNPEVLTAEILNQENIVNTLATHLKKN